MAAAGRAEILCTRRFKLNDAFFHAGDYVLYNVQNKQATYDIDTDEFVQKAFLVLFVSGANSIYIVPKLGKQVILNEDYMLKLDFLNTFSLEVPAFSCHIAGCMTTFHSVQDYELHYNSLHRHVCCDCKKLFPTNHLLEIHALESHDVLFKLLAEKQNMYQCLVEGCQDKFVNANERKVHLVKFHHYPHDFRFGRLQKEKKCNQKTGNNEENPEVENMQTTVDTEETTQTLTVKYAPKIPKSICFGQGTTRGFMSRGRGSHTQGKRKGKHWHQAKDDEDMDTSVNIEEVTFKDLSDSLPG